jgi:hypothetical protein
MSEGSPVEVEADLTPDGLLRPRAFHWEGRRVAVRSWGRTWDDGAGRHVLVMSESGRVYELGYDPLTAAWRLIDRPMMFAPRPRV